MKTKTIEHTFGTLAIQFDESKTWTSDDEEIINSYIDVLNIENANIEKTKQVYNRHIELDKKVEEFNENLEPIKLQIKAAKDVTDEILLYVSIKKTNALDNWYEKVNLGSEAIQKIVDNIKPLMAFCDLTVAEYDILINDEECEHIWNLFSAIQSKHYNNWENNAIDISSFDSEDQKMRGTFTFYSNHNKELLLFCDRTIHKYNLMIAEIDKIYRNWEEFGKRVKLIELLINERAGFTQMHLN